MLGIGEEIFPVVLSSRANPPFRCTIMPSLRCGLRVGVLSEHGTASRSEERQLETTSTALRATQAPGWPRLPIVDEARDCGVNWFPIVKGLEPDEGMSQMAGRIAPC